MATALLAGVSGLNVHQAMLDVTGNNLANLNTMGFKSSSVSFADVLNMTIRSASAPGAQIGGTNPLQIGSGVQLASVTRNLAQGDMQDTGQPLDMGIEGLRLEKIKGKQKFTPMQFKDILNVCVDIERISEILRKRGVNFKDYVSNYDPKKQCMPAYMVKVDGKQEFVFDDKEGHRSCQ